MQVPNRTSPPESHLLEKLSTNNPRIIRSKTGIPIYLFETASEPIIRIDFIFKAGTRFQDKIFVAGCTNSLLIEGTENATGAEIAESVDFLGSYIYPFFDRDEAGITTVCLKKHLEKSLKIVMDILKKPSFPEKELEIYKAKKEQSIILDKQKADSVVRKLFLENLLGPDHPYGIHGDLEDLQVLETKDLVAFHQAHYHTDNLTVLMTCDSDSDHIDILDKALTDWDCFDSFIPNRSIIPQPVRQQIQTDYTGVPHSTQASIRLGKIVPGPGHPDFNRITILNALLGGYFGSRLMQNIREDKGLTYGIGSALLSFKELTILTIGSSVAKDNYKEAISECFVEFEKLCNELCDTDELERVKNYLVGDLQRQLDGPFTSADTYKSLLFHGLDFQSLNVFFKELKEITPQQIFETASKYLQAKDFLVLTAGPLIS